MNHESHMKCVSDTFMGFAISVRVGLNDRNAWVAEIEFSKGDTPLLDIWPRTTQPEWLTPEEAIRDAIEWSRRTLIQQSQCPSHTWVETRERASNWARSEVNASLDGKTFNFGD